MELTEKQQDLLRMLPGVDHVLELAKSDSFFEKIPKSLRVRCVRSVIETLRNTVFEDSGISAESLSDIPVIEAVKARVNQEMTPNLRRVINATGVVVHTNLGRSLLAEEAVENLLIIASRYSNLEFDLELGKRGSRYSCVENLLCELSGAESAMVVNNNAAAVLLCLETLAKGKKVIVSRGELVEIGGSFRIPDVMAKSGAVLKEVGTTNRTHLRDYAGALEEDTALLLKVHTSNYSVVGFTAEVTLKDMAFLASSRGIPVMNDLGSGTFVDFSRYGMLKEPTVQESVSTGADIVTFSGDKLLGGPQAGIILGKKKLMDSIRKNPLTRALRIDRLTLAALETTLRIYRDPEKAVRVIPTLRMLTCDFRLIEKKAGQLAEMLKGLNDSRVYIQVRGHSSRVGGGALPLQELPSMSVEIRIKNMSVNAVERAMRANMPPVIGRVAEDFFIMDMRTVEADELPVIGTAFETLLKKGLS